MLKVFYFFKRRPDISAHEFHRYWREEHGPLFCGTQLAQRYVVRYEQNHTSEANAVINGDDFDGVSIMWFRTIDDIRGYYADPDFAAVLIPDGDRFIDAAATRRVITEAEEVLIADSE
jgi:EthD domain